MLQPDEPLFLGISGAKLPADVTCYDLGLGLSLIKTHAHVMRPMVVAFSPAPPGKHHPGPWKTAGSDAAQDIHMQLCVAGEYESRNSFDPLNVGWWIVSLLRLYCAPQLFVPIVSTKSLSDINDSDAPVIVPLETGRLKIVIGAAKSEISAAELNWLKLRWRPGAALMRRNKLFNLAFQAFDQMALSGHPTLYLLGLWSALEALFSPGRHELRFRVSSLIATYLEAPGNARHSLQKSILKLYDARSSSVHTAAVTSDEDLVATHQLLRRVLLKMLKEDMVPTHENLERDLFGAQTADG